MSQLLGDNDIRKAQNAIPYGQKVLNSSPVAYWPLNEAAGAIAHCQVNALQGGTYLGGFTLGQPGIGDGGTAVLFNGTTGRVNVFSATLAAAFDHDVGSYQLWLKMSAGVWTDGVNRGIAVFADDANNYIHCEKFEAGGVHTLSLRRKANATADTVACTNPGLEPWAYDWIPVHFTWDKPGDMIRGYLFGTEFDNLSPLAAWAGAGLTTATLGLRLTEYLPGSLAHCALWDRVLAPGEIAALAVV